MVKIIFGSFIGFATAISLLISILMLHQEWTNFNNKINLCESINKLNEKKIDDIIEKMKETEAKKQGKPYIKIPMTKNPYNM